MGNIDWCKHVLIFFTRVKCQNYKHRLGPKPSNSGKVKHHCFTQGIFWTKAKSGVNQWVPSLWSLAENPWGTYKKRIHIKNNQKIKSALLQVFGIIVLCLELYTHFHNGRALKVFGDNECLYIFSWKKMGTFFLVTTQLGPNTKLGSVVEVPWVENGLLWRFERPRREYTMYMHFRVPDSQSKSWYNWELVGWIVFHGFCVALGTLTTRVEHKPLPCIMGFKGIWNPPSKVFRIKHWTAETFTLNMFSVFQPAHH